jgi:hypothetical protein
VWTVKKSTAIGLRACVRMNSRHVGPGRAYAPAQDGLRAGVCWNEKWHQRDRHDDERPGVHCPKQALTHSPSLNRIDGCGERDDEYQEHCVVPAKERLSDDGKSSNKSTCYRYALNETMPGEESEWQSRRHHELNVRRAGKYIRAEGERECGGGRSAPIAGQVPRETVGAKRTSS